jgi:hypothetical protein
VKYRVRDRKTDRRKNQSENKKQKKEEIEIGKGKRYSERKR